MKASRVWLQEVRRVVLLMLAGAVLGWIFGHVMLGLGLSILAIAVNWSVQLWRIQAWLNHPQTAPPESHGIWGDIFDRIYHMQRKEKQAREQLQSTVDYLRNSFASMRDGTVMVDGNGSIQWSNEAAEALLGLRYPADRGQAILNLVRIPEFHHYFLAADYTRSLQINIGVEADLFLQIDVTLFGVGERLIFVRDVTAVTRMEKIRRDFVANVSHELRTPLTVITGYLDTILDNDEALEPRLRKPLQQMAQQSARMENLLKDLLWLSRIESVDDSDKHSSVNICALLEELRDEVATTYPDRMVNLDIDCPARVMGNYRELYSAVSNLILNAIKYSSQDSTVTIQWHREGDSCHLSVRDTGQGIDAVHLPRLTERFYRVDNSRSSATGGTGLGLAIVKHVAAGHNARLNIESVPGVGSSFSLAFTCGAILEDSDPGNEGPIS